MIDGQNESDIPRARTLQVHIEQVSCDALNCVIEGKDMDALAILHVRALLQHIKTFSQKAKQWRYRYAYLGTATRASLKSRAQKPG